MDVLYANQGALERALAEQARLIREQEQLDIEKAQVEYMLFVQAERDRMGAARNTLAGYYHGFDLWNNQ